MKQAMEKLGTVLTNNHVKDSIKKYDTNQDGVLSLEEYAQVFDPTNAHFSTEPLRQAFVAIDFNGNGFISPAELKILLEKLGEKATNEELDDMIKSADVDGDGYLSFEEWTKYMSQ